MKHLFLIAISCLLWMLCKPGAHGALLIWIALAPWFLACYYCSSFTHAALLGWLAGCLFWLLSTWGCIYLLSDIVVGGKFVAASLVFLLAAINAIPYGIFGYTLVKFRWLDHGIGIVSAAAIFSLLLSWLTFIFPVGIALSQFQQLNFLQVLDIGGPPLLTFFIILVNLIIASALVTKSSIRSKILLILLAISFVLALWLYGLLRIHYLQSQAHSAPQINIGIVQANYQLDGETAKKFYTDNNAGNDYEDVVLFSRHLAEQGKKSHHPLDFIVWPEIPDLLNLNWYWHRSKLTNWLKEINTPTIIVAEQPTNPSNWPFSGAYYTVGTLFDTHGQILGTQKKINLVPFAEKIPFADHYPALAKLFPAGGGYQSGQSVTPILLKPNIRAAILICYDAIFSSTIKEAIDHGANLIISPADDGWFGHSTMTDFSLAESLFQAVSFRVPLVKVANTGISVVVDQTGKIVATSGPKLYTAKTFSYNLPIPPAAGFYRNHVHFIYYVLIFLASLFFIRRANTLFFPK